MATLILFLVLGVSSILVNVDSPNQGFTYFNFFFLESDENFEISFEKYFDPILSIVTT